MLILFYFLLFIVLVYILLIVYYLLSWLSIPGFIIANNATKSTVKISVVIPARNEAGNISACVESILKQSYQKELFEILVVDDHSTDNTAEIVRSFHSSSIRLINLKDHIEDNSTQSFKKKAIEVAIGQASGTLIVTTDADCIAPVNWLQTIAAFFEQHHPDFIVMPVAISKHSRFIELFQSLDFMSLQGITGASVSKKFHSMCNGANLAYTKKSFDAVNGFAGIDAIASGDDMLLMHKIYKYNPEGIAYLKSKDVIVQTQPVASVSAFLQQRIRWASKAGSYDDKRIIAVLFIVYLVNVMLLTMPFAAIFYNPVISLHIYPVTVAASLVEWWLMLIVFKTIAELIFLLPIARFFNQQKTLIWFPFMQPFHILYTVIAGWLGKFGAYKWKDRTVK